MTAQGIAGHHLGLAVGGSGVEIIDTVGDGIIDHGVDGFLVQAAAATEAAASGDGRKTHAAQAEHA